VIVIVSGSATDCKERQHGSENNERCIPKVLAIRFKRGSPIPGESARIGTVYARQTQNRSEGRNNGCALLDRAAYAGGPLHFGLFC